MKANFGNSMRVLAVVISIFAFTLAASAQPTPAPIEQIQLTVHPAPLPAMAMRQHFLPELVDQTPGNAGLLYLAAAQQVAIARASDPSNTHLDDDNVFRWLATPIEKLPREEVQALLNRYSGALEQLRLAALRDRCDFDPPYRTEGIRTLLPHVVDARALARLACLSARLKIANGQFDSAIADMGLPMSQAEHLNQGPAILIQLLVADSCAQLSLNQMQDLMAADRSPNLYWALGDLPTPLLNARSMMKFERASPYFSIPLLKEARAGKLTPEQWRQLSVALVEIHNNNLHSYGPSPAAAQLMIVLLAVKEYPIAKQYLLDQQMPLKEIDAMSASAVLGLYQVRQFEYWTQELDKCLTLPFPQAMPLLDRTEKQMREVTSSNPTSLIAVFAPSIKSAYANLVMVDRKIVLLRTVEAIRAYAAAHDGQPPRNLADMTETPAPLDPMTGQAFIYKTTRQEITLEAPTIELALPVATGIRVSLKFVK